MIDFVDTWGFADVEAAIESISDWTKGVVWEGPLADKNRWLVSGHSNGGMDQPWSLNAKANIH